MTVWWHAYHLFWLPLLRWSNSSFSQLFYSYWVIHIQNDSHCMRCYICLTFLHHLEITCMKFSATSVHVLSLIALQILIHIAIVLSLYCCCFYATFRSLYNWLFCKSCIHRSNMQFHYLLIHLLTTHDIFSIEENSDICWFEVTMPILMIS